MLLTKSESLYETQQIGHENSALWKETVRTSAAMPIGKIEAFDETSDDWNTCVERVEQYFIAN